MKIHALFASTLIAALACAPVVAAEGDATAPESTQDTTSSTLEEISETATDSAAETEEDAPAQSIDISTFQESELPGDEPLAEDETLLTGESWTPPPVEPPGPPQKGTAEQLREAARIRRARTIALRDPVVQNERVKAESAITPEGRRTALRNYYLLLHNRMVQLEPTLKDLLKKDLVHSLLRLEQRRVYPSVLVENYQPLPGSRAADYAQVVTEITEVTEVTEVPASPETEQ